MAPRADDSPDAPASSQSDAPRWLPAAAAVLGLVAVIAVVWFTVPSTIALIDRVVPLSELNVVRIYLLWPLVVTGLLLAGLLVATRRDQPRRAIVTGVLLGTNVILLGVLLADRRDFISEGNSLTWFTSIVLLGASAAATVNFILSKDLDRRRGFWRAVWGFLALVFAFVAIDEALALHELAGSVIDRLMNRPESTDASPGGVTQDYITVLYAAAAVVAAGAMLVVHRSGWIERGRVFHLVAAVGVGAYAIAVALDNVDKVQSLQSRSIDLIYLANAVEEVLEFTAACLFLAAALIAIVELRRVLRGGERRDSRRLPFIGSRPARAALVAVAAVVALAAIVLPVVARPPESLIAETDEYEVTELAGVGGGPVNPDGIRYADGRLYVTDDVEGTVLVRENSEFRRLAGRDDGFSRPETAAVAPDGSIFVSDDISNELLVIREGAAPEVVARPTDGLLGPRGLVFGPDGALYISDRLGVSIVRYADGSLETFAGALEGISEPEELTVDDEGRIYVAEEVAGRVLRVDGSGQAEIFLDQSHGIGSPEGIVAADGFLYVADAIHGAVFRFDENGDGGPIVTFAPRFRTLEGLAVGENGELYVGIRRNAPLSGLVVQLTPRAGE